MEVSSLLPSPRMIRRSTDNDAITKETSLIDHATMISIKIRDYELSKPCFMFRVQGAFDVMLKQGDEKEEYLNPKKVQVTPNFLSCCRGEQCYQQTQSLVTSSITISHQHYQLSETSSLPTQVNILCHNYFSNHH
jgi:hypothetical protein